MSELKAFSGTGVASRLLTLLSVMGFAAACQGAGDAPAGGEGTEGLIPEESMATALKDTREVHLTNVRQLTTSGQNAEAYFSFDGTRLTYQATSREGGCDQIYTMDLDGQNKTRVSTGGRTTCSYFFPGGDKILYSSTHHHDASCPAEPDMSRGYVWAVYPSYDIWVSNADGSELTQLTAIEGYDAEATFSPKGDRIVFTSMRDGDLDLYSMNPDGTDVARLTDRLGYDGGAFYSPDGSQIVWRASYPEEPEAQGEYRALLAEGLIRPSQLDLWIMNADGSNKRQVTDNGAANFGPFWHPSGEKLLFSSNMGDERGREFDIYMINVDGTGLEQITFTEEFDGFPVFSPDGSQLVWGSNRFNELEAETNVFIADWVETP